MSKEIASLTAEAEIAGSAPVITEPIEEKPAVVAEPAPAKEEDEKPVEPGKAEEKDSDSKAVKELIAQRKKRQKAEKEAAYWRGVAEGTQGAKKPVTEQAEPEPIVRPKLEDYPEDYEAFKKAEEDYLISVAERRVEERLEKKMAARETASHDDKVKQTFDAMIEEHAETNEDFPDIVKDMGDRIHPAMGRAIMVSKQSADLIMYFHNNPKVEKEITKLAFADPIAAATRVAEIAFELKTKPAPEPPKKVTTAPEPITTIKTTGPSTTEDISELPVGEYIRLKNERERSRSRYK